MKCQDFNLFIIDDIYNEISPENKKSLDVHLTTCPKCQKEYIELKSSASILNSWEDESLSESYIPFATSKPAKSLKIFYRSMMVAAAILLVFSLFNFRLSLNENNFDISFSLFGSASNTDQLASEIMSNGSNVEQIQLMVNLIEESKRIQKEEMVILLTDFYQAVEMRRQADLKVIGQGMETLRSSSNQRIDDTERTIQSLVQYTGSILDKGNYIKSIDTQ